MVDDVLRRKLLEHESLSEEMYARYRKEVRAMIERRLTPAERVGWALTVVVSLAMAAWLFVARFLALPTDAPLTARIGLLAGTAFPLAWAGVSLSVLRRGAYDLRRHGMLMSSFMVIFMVILLTIFLYAGATMPDAAKGNRVILFGLVFWCAFAIPSLVGAAVQQAELRLREQMLALRLELAQLGEKVGK